MCGLLEIEISNVMRRCGVQTEKAGRDREKPNNK